MTVQYNVCLFVCLWSEKRRRNRYDLFYGRSVSESLCLHSNCCTEKQFTLPPVDPECAAQYQFPGGN
jgi:hypothetical protein